MNLGQQVRRIRNHLGLTLEQLAKRSGVDVGTISALEVRASTRSKYAQQLAAGLGVSLDELLSGKQVDAFQSPQTMEHQWLLRTWDNASEESREVARFALSELDAPLPSWADKDMLRRRCAGCAGAKRIMNPKKSPPDAAFCAGQGLI